MLRLMPSGISEIISLTAVVWCLDKIVKGLKDAARKWSTHSPVETLEPIGGLARLPEMGYSMTSLTLHCGHHTQMCAIDRNGEAL